MVAVFGVLAVMAGIWSAIKYQFVYNAVIDKFPPQFQDDLTSRYALDAFVMTSITPLSWQEEYVKHLGGGCVMCLCVSLAFFSIAQPLAGCVILIAFFANVWSTMKSWKIYKENCERAEARGDKE